MSWAANSGITYQGRILKPDGTPLSGSNVQFRLQIRTPNANDCLMYEEVQALDMRNANGQFSLTMADGTGSRMDSTGLGLDRIFANRGSFTFSPATCTSGSAYTPTDGDGRNLVVLFKDETMTTWEPIPAQKINFVPYAFESKQIAGFTADSLLRVVDGSGDPLTGLAPLSNAQYTALMDLVNGSSAAYTKAGQLNGVALPTMTTGEVLGWNGTTWVSTTSTPGANTITTTMIQNGAVDGTKLDPAISISTSGTIASAVTTTRDFKIYAASPSNFYVGMLADPTLAASYTLTWPLTAGSANQVLTTDGSGKLTWTTLSSAGITDLTGEVTATGPGSAAATVVSVGGVTSANVALGANAANDATSLNTPNTIVKRDGAGGFAAGAVTQGSSIYKDTGSNTVTVQAPANVTSSYVLQWPVSVGSNNQILTTDGTGALSWSDPAVTGLTALTGDVTASGPGSGVATIASNAITTSKISDKAVTYAKIQDVTSGKLLGRSSAGAGAVEEISVGTGLLFSGGILSSTASDSFAALPCGDGYVPYKNSGAWTCKAVAAGNTSGAIVSRDSFGSFIANNAKLTSLSLDNAGSSVTLQNLAGSTYTLTLPATAGSNDQVLTTDGLGGLSWTTPSTDVGGSGTTNFVPKFTATRMLGDSLIYDDGAKVGIGTTAPGYKLDVNGPVNATQLLVNGSDVSASAGAWTVAGGNVYRPSGKVSVGTSSAFGALHVKNATNQNFVIAADGNSGDTGAVGVVALNDANSGWVPMDFQASRFGFGIGNVGIGTTNPQALLHVYRASGDAEIEFERGNNANASYLSFVPQGSLSSTNVKWLAGMKETTNAFSIASYDGSTLNQQLWVDRSGKVGIGTTSPGYKLDVSGSANATQVCIGGDCKSAWPSGGGSGDFKKDGSVAMTGALKIAEGTTSAPSLSFALDTDTGFAHSTEDEVALIAGGMTWGYFNTGVFNWSGDINGGRFKTYPYFIENAGSPSYVMNASGDHAGLFGIGTDVIGFSTASAERVRIAATGEVGIGTTAPRSALDVNGAITSRPSMAVSSGSTVDFADANFRHTTLQCGSFALWNMKDGSTYSFIVQNTASATCAFSAFSDGGSTPLTVKMPPDHGATTAGTETVYSFMVVGSKVYVTWVPGY